VRFKDGIALNGSEGAIWSRVSNLEAISAYWPAIISVQLQGSDAGRSRALVRFSFGGESTALITVDQADRTLLIYYTEGALTGTHRVTVGHERVDVEVDVEFHGRPHLLSHFREERFVSDTKQGLLRLISPMRV
jgi:hypothetical protein